MTDAVRTPDELLEGLPDFPFQSSYREHEGLRLAHLDEGDGAPVVFFHGEPTWSFLWRKVIPPVRDAGFRCIAPDLPGLRALGQAARRRLVQLRPPHGGDAGAVRGARPARRHGRRPRLGRADRAAGGGRAWPTGSTGIVVLDTGLFTGHQQMNDAWMAFRDFVERTEDLPVGLLVRRACKNDPGDEVIAGYEAPYPSAASKAGARAFPLILPISPTCPARPPGSACSRRCAATRGRSCFCGRTQTRCCRSRPASGSPQRWAPRSTT